MSNHDLTVALSYPRADSRQPRVIGLATAAVGNGFKLRAASARYTPYPSLIIGDLNKLESSAVSPRRRR
jgi:hypothetical protein